uniref:Uncharacterized protein n=1 Tax=Heterorhabditis bacteriophora TaxID=37862 RepID=A0A1I7WYL9_HETBA
MVHGFPLIPQSNERLPCGFSCSRRVSILTIVDGVFSQAQCSDSSNDLKARCNSCCQIRALSDGLTTVRVKKKFCRKVQTVEYVVIKEYFSRFIKKMKKLIACFGLCANPDDDSLPYETARGVPFFSSPELEHAVEDVKSNGQIHSLLEAHSFNPPLSSTKIGENSTPQKSRSAIECERRLSRAQAIRSGGSLSESFWEDIRKWDRKTKNLERRKTISSFGNKSGHSSKSEFDSTQNEIPSYRGRIRTIPEEKHADTIIDTDVPGEQEKNGIKCLAELSEDICIIITNSLVGCS